MLIGSDFVHYVIKRMTKGIEMPAGTEKLWKREGRHLGKHLKALDSLASEEEEHIFLPIIIIYN